jgi:hypothetical protein
MEFLSKQLSMAFGINAITLRKWQALEDPLRLDADERKSGAWRRYTFADAVRTGILSHLVFTLKISSDAAIRIVNSLFDEVAVASAAPAGSLLGEESVGPWLILHSLEPFEIRHRRIVAKTREELAAALHRRWPAVVVDVHGSAARAYTSLTRWDIQNATDTGSEDE